MQVTIPGLSRKDFKSKGRRYAWWRLSSYTTKAEAETRKKRFSSPGEKVRISPSMEVVNGKFIKVYSVYTRTVK